MYINRFWAWKPKGGTHLTSTPLTPNEDTIGRRQVADAFNAALRNLVRIGQYNHILSKYDLPFRVPRVLLSDVFNGDCDSPEGNCEAYLDALRERLAGGRNKYILFPSRPVGHFKAILARGSLVVCRPHLNVPPLWNISSSEGFVKDLTRSVADILSTQYNVPLRLSFMLFPPRSNSNVNPDLLSDCKSALVDGSCDICLAEQARSFSRARNISFTFPYLVDRPALLVHPGSDIRSLRDALQAKVLFIAGRGLPSDYGLPEERTLRVTALDDAYERFLANRNSVVVWESIPLRRFVDAGGEFKLVSFGLALYERAVVLLSPT